MANPLFNMLGGNRPSVNPNLTQFMNEFNRFKSGFKGDARSEIQRLLNTGQMTQEQYNRLSQMAQQLMSMLPK